MLKSLLLLVAAACAGVSASAFPKALYVKKGDTYVKYNFGVAGDLKFSNGGKTLTVTGYSEAINLEAIDYITFTAPVDDNALTPSQQKEKLIQIGQDIYNKIDCNDQAEVLRMVDRFCNEYTSYYLPEEYYDVHNNAPGRIPHLLKEMLTAMKSCANGNASAVRKIKRNGVELYRLDDYYGVYQANTRTECWEKLATADYFEMRFPAADTDFYKVKVQPSGSVMHWDESDFAADIPERLDISVVKGNTPLCSGWITFEVERGVKLNNTIHFVSNNITLHNESRTDATKITDTTVLTLDGEKLVDSHNVLRGRNLLDYDDWNNALDQGQGGEPIFDEDGSWIGYEADTYDNIVANRFTYGTSETDILNGRLQIRGKVSQIGKLWDNVDTDADYSWPYPYTSDDSGDYRTYYYNNKDVVESHVNHLNNYSDISFYYDRTNQMQGFMAWDIDEDVYDWYRTSDGYVEESTGDWIITWEGFARYIDYFNTPLLVFPDLTSYAIEDYFNETNFGTLVDDYDAIIDDYYDVVGRH